MFHWSILLSLVACAQKGPPPQETGQPTETGSVPDDTASGDTVPDDTATETEPPDDDHDGYAVVDGDCDDTDRQVNPGESELCGNAVDDDCDGTADGGCGPISSVTDLTVFSGGTRGYTRRGLSGAGDMDADGFDDVVIGAYCDSEVDVCAGAAFLVFGSAEPHSVHLEHALKLTGEFGYDYAGWAVAGVGDTDADGYPDLMVGGSMSNTVWAVLGGVR